MRPLDHNYRRQSATESPHHRDLVHIILPRIVRSPVNFPSIGKKIICLPRCCPLNETGTDSSTEESRQFSDMRSQDRTGRNEAEHIGMSRNNIKGICIKDKSLYMRIEHT